MRFNLGVTLSVRITRRPIIWQGQERDAVVDLAARAIRISGTIEPRERAEALFHELRHAWQDITGQAGRTDPEADALDVGRFMAVVFEQFEAQGGSGALMAMQPGPEPTPAPAGAAIAIDRHECPRCGAWTMTGDVCQGPAGIHPTYGETVATRWFTCGGCDTLIHWDEVTDQSGNPLGRYIPNTARQLPPGPARRRWLAARELVS